MLGGVLHDESFISSCQQPDAAPLPAHAPIALEASGALWFPACRSLGISAQINSRPRSPGHLPVMAEESVAPAPPPAEPAKPQKKRPDKFITGLHYVAWSPTGLHWRLRSECLPTPSALSVPFYICRYSKIRKEGRPQKFLE